MANMMAACCHCPRGGYAFAFDWLTVEPTIGLNYSHLWQDSFNESGTATDGNNYGLHVNDVSMDSFRSALGVRLAAQFGKKDGVQFIPALRAVWEHEFMDRYADVNARFVGGSGDFNVRGVELGADSGILGVGLTVAFNKTVQGFVNYDANLNSQLTSSTILRWIEHFLVGIKKQRRYTVANIDFRPGRKRISAFPHPVGGRFFGLSRRRARIFPPIPKDDSQCCRSDEP